MDEQWLGYIFGPIVQIFSFLINTFTSFYSGRYLELFLAFFAISMIVKYIVYPIIGSSSGSDKVKRKKGDE